MHSIATSDAPLENKPPTREQEAHAPLRKARLRLLVALPVITVLCVLAMGVLAIQLLLSLEALIGEVAFTPALVLLVCEVLALVAVAAVLGWGVAHTILKPLSTLTEHVMAMAKGIPVEGVTETNYGEFGALGEKFNTMLKSLQEQAQQRSNVIMEQFAGALVTTDAQGRLTGMNTAAGRMFGIDSEMSIGKELIPLLGGEEKNPELKSCLDHLLGGEEITEVQRIQINSPGHHGEPVDLTGSIQRSLRGEIEGAIINLRDVRKIHSIHERMERNEQMAALSTFASGVAHEIRNPLAAIKAVAQLLKEGKDEAENPWVRHLSIIDTQSNRLERIMAELDHFTQAGATKRELCEINELVHEAVILAAHRLGINEVTNIHGMMLPLPPVRGQADRILQAVYHVIRNALEATADNDGEIWIKTRLAPSPPAAVIEIENSGSSIPPDQREQIFIPFFTTKDEGPGLGLAVARQVMNQHGGSISVQSEGDRVKFTLKIPGETTVDEGADE